MCGIAGAFDVAGSIVPEDVDRMVAALRHRGPDSAGVFGGRHGAIGQSRLAVIDLVTGDPPITDDSGDIGVTLNGEIYNFCALQEDVVARGHTLTTTGDTEVIAHLAAHLEPVELARALDGMFAAAVLDERRQRLVLLRDRLGKKPLYWWSDGRVVAFGSELKALLAHPSVPRRLDASAIPAYLTFGYVPTPRTFFEGVQSLPPGHVLVADEGGVRVEQYWDMPVAGVSGVERLALSRDDAAQECRAVLERAVARRLVADVPLGAFLSGGIDSSAVVALMAGMTDHPVRTFTIGFEDRDGFDERPYARLVAERFHTDHTEFVVHPEKVDLVERIGWHMDQPFADSSALPTYILSELTRGHVTVALCGDGGDEVFAGYERFLASLLASAYANVPSPARRGVVRAAGRLPRRGLGAKAQRFIDRAGMGMPDALRAWISYVPEDVVDALVHDADDWATVAYRDIWSRSAGAATLHRVLHLNMRTYLLDDLLPKVDRMSMAHGLEVRSPFLDPEVVEFGMRVDASLHVRHLRLKALLKDALRGLLPDEILSRSKRGFGVPLGRWFRSDLRSYLERSLGSSARVRAHLDGNAVDALLAEHAAGEADRSKELWSLLMLETFLEREGW